MNTPNFLDEISNFIFTSKYARYNEAEGRRETWEECVDRVTNMHVKKFRKKLSKEDMAEVKWAFQMVKEKKVVPSLRSLQFGGKAIEAASAKLYNCSMRHVDSPRAFSEVFYLLLCGCGVGLGLSKHFIGRLPDLVNAGDKTGSVLTYAIEDSIEGWADSVEALLNCYFRNTAYTGRRIIFDYSKIRPAGAPLKTSGGLAPGYKGLKAAHKKIKALLDHIIEDLSQTRLKPINAYDIIMHTADAVLSGGVRRSATIAIFDLDDEEMMNAKTYFKVSKFTKFSYDEDTKLHTGKVTVNKKVYEIHIKDKHFEFEHKMLTEQGTVNWTHIEPQRARSNNSVLLLRDKVTEEQFRSIVDRTRQFGEPGFIFADHPWQVNNPCQPDYAPFLTPGGIRQLKDINIGDTVWSESGWTTVLNKWSTGVKPVYKYQTSAGSFIGTEDHRLVSGGVKTPAKDCTGVDVLAGPRDSVLRHHQDVMDGLVFGDGSVHKASNDLVYLLIGENDQSYFDSEVAPLITKPRPGLSPKAYEVTTTIQASDLPHTYARSIPSRFIYSTPSTAAGFLRGLYSANGSICGNRVTLKAASKTVIEQVQLMLSSLGIRSYFTKNIGKLVEFDNGMYYCKDSYDLNISIDRERFQQAIGFIQPYKTQKLQALIDNVPARAGRTSFEVQSTEFLEEVEVFDLTVDNNTHTYWTGGLNVSNCGEISSIPVTEDGVCGTQFCNLTSINGAAIKSVEDYLSATKAATIIGTLQASYTDAMRYLNAASRSVTEEEALLGVSVTGFMDNPLVLLNPANQQAAAKYAVEVNTLWAKKIGINPAARVTTVKPEGTSSLVLRSASGIHPHHARRYFRRVQCNKIDAPYKFFKKLNPHMCEPGVWSANGTDDVVTFPLTVSDSAMIKEDLSAIGHLEIIRSTQQNWIIPGTNPEAKKKLSHNVSCTVVVKDDEWEPVLKYLYENRHSFAAVSLLSFFGDKLYQQAPLEAVTTPEDEERWKNIVGNYKVVDYTKLQEDTDVTKAMDTVACGGGACEIV